MANMTEAWLVESIDADLRRVADGTLKSGAAGNSNEHWYQTGSGLQVVLLERTPRWVQIVKLQATSNKVVSATLSDTHRTVAVRFSQDSLKQARDESSSSLGPSAVGCYLVLKRYEICVSDSGPLDQRVTLLVRAFKYKGAKSRDLLKPKPLATDPRIQATLREVSDFVKTGEFKTAEDAEGVSDTETRPASQPTRVPVHDSEQTLATQAPQYKSDVEMLQGINLSAPKEARKQGGVNGRGSDDTAGTRSNNHDSATLLSLLENSHATRAEKHRESEPRPASASPPAHTKVETQCGTHAAPEGPINVTVHEGDFSFTDLLPRNLDVPQDQREVLERPQSWQFKADGKKCSGLNLPSRVLEDLRARARGRRSANDELDVGSSNEKPKGAASASSDSLPASAFSENSSSDNEQPLSGSEWPDSDYEAAKAPRDQLPPDSSLEKPQEPSPQQPLPPAAIVHDIRSQQGTHQHEQEDYAADDPMQIQSSPPPAPESLLSDTRSATKLEKRADTSCSPANGREAQPDVGRTHVRNDSVKHSTPSDASRRSSIQQYDARQNTGRASRAREASSAAHHDEGRSSDRRYGLFTSRQSGNSSRLSSPRLPGSSPTSVVPATYSSALENGRASTFVTPQHGLPSQRARKMQDSPQTGPGGFSVHPSSDAGFEGAEPSSRPHKKPRLSEQLPQCGADHVRDLAKQHKRKSIAARKTQKHADDAMQVDPDEEAPQKVFSNAQEYSTIQVAVPPQPAHTASGTKPNSARSMTTAGATGKATSQASPFNDLLSADPVKGQRTIDHDLFSRFQAAYLSYTGDRKRFMARCRMIGRLHTNKQLHRSLWDDFVIRHETNYLPYAQQCDEEGDVPRPYPDYYDDEFDEPQYTKKIMTPESLKNFITSAFTERAASGPERSSVESIASIPATHSPTTRGSPNIAVIPQQFKGPNLPAKPPTPTAFSNTEPEASNPTRPVPHTSFNSDRSQTSNSSSHPSATPTQTPSYSRYPSGPSTSARIPTGPRSTYSNLTWRPPSSPAASHTSSDGRRQSYSSLHQPSPLPPSSAHPRTTSASVSNAPRGPTVPLNRSSPLAQPSYSSRPIPPPPPPPSTTPRLSSLQQPPPSWTSRPLPPPPSAPRSSTQKAPEPPSKPSMPPPPPRTSEDTYVKSRLGSSRTTERDHYDGRRRVDFAYRDWAP